MYEDSDAALQMEGFYAQIGTPLLSNIKIEYLNESVDAGKSTRRSEAPKKLLTDTLVRDVDYNSYYAGGEIITVGKMSDKYTVSDLSAPAAPTEFAASVRANGADGARVMRVSGRVDALRLHR